MEQSTEAGSIWSLVTIVGPILFVIVGLWVVTHNRRTKRQRDRAEQATRELYERSDQDSKARDKEN